MHSSGRKRFGRKARAQSGVFFEQDRPPFSRSVEHKNFDSLDALLGECVRESASERYALVTDEEKKEIML